MVDRYPAASEVQVHIRADAGAEPAAQDIATFIYDLNLLYELHVLDQEPDGHDRLSSSSNFIYARNQRGVAPELKLRVREIQLGSPLDVTVLLPFVSLAAGALLATAKALEVLYTLPANQRLKDAQARLAAVKADRAEFDLAEAQHARLVDHTHDRAPSTGRPTAAKKEAVDPIGNVERRLRHGRMRITSIDIDLPPDS